MKLRQLAAFIRVCQIGSITRAAGELNIAQPALGLQIRNLETEFGAELVTRGPRGVQPTPAGELVLSWARDVLQSQEAVRHKVREFAAQLPAGMRLGLIPSIAGAVSNQLTEWENLAGNRASLTVVKAFSRNISQLVEMGQLDFGLTCSVKPAPSLESRPILMERLYFMSGANRSEGPVTLKDALDCDLALPSGRDSVRRAVEQGALEQGLVPKKTVDINSIETAKDLAVAGIAASILPLGCAPDAAQLGLTLRPIISPVLMRPIFLVRRRDHDATSLESTLTDFIISTLMDLEMPASMRPYHPFSPDPETAFVSREIENSAP